MGERTITVSMSTKQATWTRQAIANAVKATPWTFDEEQHEGLAAVERMLADAVDDELAAQGG